MNKVPRILLASGLAATASLMAISPAFAGTTDKVDLSGTVPSNLSLTVTATSEASAMIFVPGNNTYDLKIANITGAATNSPNGLKVSVLSSWRLQSTSTADYITITGFGESTSTSSSIATAHRRRLQDNTLLSNASFDLAITNTNAAGAAPDSSLYISYNVYALAPAGTYTGSITFTATDK